MFKLALALTSPFLGRDTSEIKATAYPGASFQCSVNVMIAGAESVTLSYKIGRPSGLRLDQ